MAMVRYCMLVFGRGRREETVIGEYLVELVLLMLLEDQGGKVRELDLYTAQYRKCNHCTPLEYRLVAMQLTKVEHEHAQSRMHAARVKQ